MRINTAPITPSAGGEFSLTGDFIIVELTYKTFTILGESISSPVHDYDSPKTDFSSGFPGAL